MAAGEEEGAADAVVGLDRGRHGWIRSGELGGLWFFCFQDG